MGLPINHEIRIPIEQPLQEIYGEHCTPQCLSGYAASVNTLYLGSCHLCVFCFVDWDVFFVEQSFNKKKQCLVCRCHIWYIREGYMTTWDVQNPNIDTYDAFSHLLQGFWCCFVGSCYEIEKHVFSLFGETSYIKIHMIRVIYVDTPENPGKLRIRNWTMFHIFQDDWQFSIWSLWWITSCMQCIFTYIGRCVYIYIFTCMYIKHLSWKDMMVSLLLDSAKNSPTKGSIAVVLFITPRTGDGSSTPWLQYTL